MKKAGGNQNPFTPEAIDLIFQSAAGIPRSINILCDSALLYGFAEEVETVDADIVKSVIGDLNLQTFIQKEPRVEQNRSGEPPVATIPRASKTAPETRKESKPDDLLKKVLLVIKKQLDKIDIKIDILRDDVLKKANGSLIVEKKRYEDLLVEHAKIKEEGGKVKKSGIRFRVKGARLGSWRRTGNLTINKQFTTGNGQLALLLVVSGML